MVDLCYDCHLNTIDKLIKKFNLSAEDGLELSKEAKRILSGYKSQSNPLIATYIHRLASEKIQCNTLYWEEKLHANKILLGDYEYWKSYVFNSNNPLFTAVKLAVAGNIIDYGAHTQPDDITKKIKELVELPFAIDHSQKLFDLIHSVESILYLGDNAGEIVFDKLLIEVLQHKKLVYVVRGKPVINDVTYEDAGLVAMDQVCDIISNGYDAPSTLMDCCSDEFLDAFKHADLIISKGQGNYEGLMDIQHKTICFLLMAKCKPVANMLGVQEGSLIVKVQNKEYN